MSAAPSSVLPDPSSYGPLPPRPPDPPVSGETVHLQAGSVCVPAEFLEPPFENDRRHVLKDLAGFLLDRHLRRLGAMRNPLERRLGRLLARLEASSGYLALGFARLSDFAAERLGISVRRMQELLRMDRGLAGLPQIAAAFEGGRITSSQLRLLLRVAAPETEAAWLGRAARLNVRLLEREVRAALREAGTAGRMGADRTGTGGADAFGPAEGGASRADESGPVGASATGTAEAGLEDEDEPGQSVGFACPDSVRERWRWAVELCRRSAGAAEPVWRCAEYIAADFLSGVPDLASLLAAACREQADAREAGGAALPGERAPHVDGGADDDGTDLFEQVLRDYEEEFGPRSWAPPAAGLRVVLPEAVRDDPADGARELDRRLRALVGLRQGLAWQQGRLLSTFAFHGLHRALGFLSFGRYCRERLGLGIRRARQLIALDRSLLGLPELEAAYRGGALSWVKASAVARVADEASEADWIRMAGALTFRRLREEVALVEARLEEDPGEWAGATPGRLRVPPGLDASGAIRAESPWTRLGTEAAPNGSEVQTCAQPVTVETPADGSEGEVQTCAPPAAGGPARGVAGDGVQTCARSWTQLRFWAPDDVAALWHHALRVCRLAAGRDLDDWECVAAMLDSFERTWDVTRDRAWRRRYRIFERDGWRCRVPGCSSRRNLHAHHVVFRSRGGGDEDDNLAVLCATHHRQGIHLGRIRCQGSTGGLLRWELGVADGGAPIATLLEDVLLADAPPGEGSPADGAGHPGARGTMTDSE